MKTIYKYEIPIEGYFHKELPVHSHILSVQIQNGKPYMWVIHNLENKKAINTFVLLMTGHSYEDDILIYYNFIGTFQLDSLVFHLFHKVRDGK